MADMLPTELDDIKRRYYRWWTISAWANDESIGVKIGPMAIFCYMWFDFKSRIAWSWLCGPEHIVFGGPL